MTKHIVIVGGGLAGLAAAAGLAGDDLDITLLESRPRLGGRAGSFRDNQTGEWIDTCQHVSMGCCTNLAHFARMVGIDDLFATQDELLFIAPEGQRCRFRDRPWPAPLHLAGAFGNLTYLSKSERRRLIRDLARLAHRRWSVDHGLSFQQWLDQHARTADLAERFWDVILVSALSESADRISVPHARKVFVEGFLAHKDGWRVQIPTVPLEELYGRRLTDWLSANRVNVQTGAGVDRVIEQDGAITAVQMRSGERIEADEFIVAVPWHRVTALLPPSLAEHESLSGVKQLESAPIASVHLWFDRPVIDVPHAVLIGRLSQWVFRRQHPKSEISNRKSQISDPESASDASPPSESRPPTRSPHPASRNAPPNYVQVVISNYVQVVISASRNIAGRSQESVIEQVVGELASIWPAVGEAQMLRSRVVTEHRAVFSPLPGVEDHRPPQASPIANLQLAGDWTNTGWPATMESAVKSGFLAAQNLLQRVGSPRSLVQPGLSPGWLARLLLRL